jgi:hypothetical protein
LTSPSQESWSGGSRAAAATGWNRTDIPVSSLRGGRYHIYTVAGNGSEGFSGDGGPATKASFDDPTGVALDAAGNLLISDTIDNRVRAVAARTGTFYGQAMTKGDIYTIAGGGTGGIGDGGPATKAVVSEPSGVTVEPSGAVIIVAADRARVVAAQTGTSFGQPMTAGDIYSVAGTGGAGFCCDGAPATTAEMTGPVAVTTDPAGNVVIADITNNRIRAVAAATGTFYGQGMTKGDIYTVAGDGVSGFSGDGGRATQAELNGPWSVAPDHAGNLVIADTGNERLRVVAAATGTFYGQAMTKGDIYLVAGNGTPGFAGDGGPATSAEFHNPDSVAVDGAGNIAVADTVSGSVPADMGNNRVRVVAAATGTFYGVPMTAGDIYTAAGNGTPGYSGDGGAATGAELDQPFGVGVDAAGNLLAADLFNGRVREIAR